MSSAVRARALLALALAFPLCACGPSCRQIAAARAALLARRRPAPTPHLRLSVPIRLANRLIAEGIEELRGWPMTLGPLGGLGRYAAALGALRLVVSSVRLVAEPQGRIGLRVALKLRDARGALLAMTVTARIKPLVSRGRGSRWLWVGVDPASLNSIKLELAADAASQLADAIHDRLSSVLRFLVRRADLMPLSAHIIDLLKARLGERLPPAWIARLAKRARLRLNLGGLPIARVTIESRRRPMARIDVDIVTTLSLRRGLRGGAGRRGDAIELRVAGGAIAELANWGMKRGLLPRRYDAGFKPRADGAYAPVFDWLGGTRPLKIHIFKLDAPCASARIGAAARVELEADSRLKISFSDREVEEIRGSIWGRLSLFFDALWTRAIQDTHRVAAQMAFAFGGRKLIAKLVGARIDQDEMRLQLALEVGGSEGAKALAASHRLAMISRRPTKGLIDLRDERVGRWGRQHNALGGYRVDRSAEGQGSFSLPEGDQRLFFVGGGEQQQGCGGFP